MNLLSETAMNWPVAACFIAACFCIAACIWAVVWMAK